MYKVPYLSILLSKNNKLWRGEGNIMAVEKRERGSNIIFPIILRLIGRISSWEGNGNFGEEGQVVKKTGGWEEYRVVWNSIQPCYGLSFLLAKWVCVTDLSLDVGRWKEAPPRRDQTREWLLSSVTSLTLRWKGVCFCYIAFFLVTVIRIRID